MSGFGSTPTTTNQSSLATNQIPISSVAEPGRTNGDLTALEGGPGATDANGNRLAPVSVYIKDGNSLTQGAKADSAATDSTSSWSIISLLKGLYAKLAGTLTVGGTVTVQQSTASSLKVDLSGTAANSTAIKTDSSATTQPVSAASLPLPSGAATSAKQP